MKSYIVFLFTALMLVVAMSCAPVGDAAIFVEVVANINNSGGAFLKSYTNPTAGGTLVNPEDFYIEFVSVKVKSASGSWIDLFMSANYGKQNIISPMNIVNGASVPADDYRALMIEYKSDWYVNYKYNSIDYGATNTNSYSNQYCILSIKESITGITNDDPYLTNAAIGIIDNSFVMFNGDNKTIFIYFDSIGMIEVLVDGGNNRTNEILLRPLVDMTVQ